MSLLAAETPLPSKIRNIEIMGYAFLGVFVPNFMLLKGGFKQKNTVLAVWKILDLRRYGETNVC